MNLKSMEPYLLNTRFLVLLNEETMRDQLNHL